VFSSVVDGWILSNASPLELEDYYAGKAAESARQSARETIAHVLAGEPREAYYQFAMTVAEADEIAVKHGNLTLEQELARGDELNGEVQG